ncbi:MAG: alpha-amylase family glycosyl hydrolase [Ferruginibacter sp.]
MQLIKKSPVILLLLLLLSSCIFNNHREENEKAEKKAEVTIVDGHAGWIMQGNIYEVNVRQYTPEGTFKAFAKSLPRLKDMGVQTLWFMPINPISVEGRKGVLGSYYAVSDYTSVNPEFGSMEDWKHLVNQAHEMGFKVIIDWVPNHTGADNPWLKTHPEFYVKDSITGDFVAPFDWTDVRKLNYAYMPFRDTMINRMKYWITDTDIDGFRCDVAGEVPDSFWVSCIRELRKVKKDLFMLAEGDKPELHRDGFDASYSWPLFDMIKKIAKGDRPAFAIDSVYAKIDSTYPPNAISLMFTSNHDENSWNKADYGTMPGPIHAPFAVFTQTAARSVPLIYSGQEEPYLDSLSFFYKDSIHFGEYKRASFYKTLLTLRKNNKALSANASFNKVNAGDSTAIYAYTRVKGNNKILVILNLSGKPQNIQLTDNSLSGNAENIFTGKQENISQTLNSMGPWGFVVYKY